MLNLPLKSFFALFIRALTHTYIADPILDVFVDVTPFEVVDVATAPLYAAARWIDEIQVCSCWVCIMQYNIIQFIASPPPICGVRPPTCGVSPLICGVSPLICEVSPLICGQMCLF